MLMATIEVSDHSCDLGIHCSVFAECPRLILPIYPFICVTRLFYNICRSIIMTVKFLIIICRKESRRYNHSESAWQPLRTTFVRVSCYKLYMDGCSRTGLGQLVYQVATKKYRMIILCPPLHMGGATEDVHAKHASRDITVASHEEGKNHLQLYIHTYVLKVMPYVARMTHKQNIKPEKRLTMD